jgi:hypothetical protein
MHTTTPHGMNVRDEFLCGTRGILFVKEKIKTLAALQAARDSGQVPLMAAAVLAAGRKPWDDRGSAPWGDGDPDGDDNGSYKNDPGEKVDLPPSVDDDDGQSAKGLRDLCGQAMTAGGIAPEATMAVVAIEARLAEISLYLPQAIAGTSGKMQASLQSLRSRL